MEIPSQQQTCKACGRPDKFDFHVPDEVWAAVVPEKYRNRVVCLYCFDDFAVEADVGYAPALQLLFFAGRRAVFEFKPLKAIDCP